jgi:hypothetical protein
MKSAMPMASGTAIRSARNADQSVPKASGATYDQKVSPRRMGMSSGLVVKAGTPSITR